MRRKLIAGAAVLALLMSSPQASAEDEIVIFGGEFEEETSKPAPKKVEKSVPVEKPQEPEQPPIEQPAQIEPQKIEQPAQIEPQEIEPPAQLEPQEIKPPAQIEPQEIEPPAQVEPQEIEPPAQIEPQEIESPVQVEPQEVEQQEVEKPFAPPTEISNDWQDRVEEPVAVSPSVQTTDRRYLPRQTQPQQNLKTLKQRFIKLAVDDTYTYYLDRNSVEWKKLPYSTSEYMADVWIRMIEHDPKPLDNDMAAYGAENFRAQIALAREQGYQYSPEDTKVLSQQAYVLEHYYLRPKTKQVQFLCELEVFGRPQNTINEREYDYRNWENLVPGSVESTIYDATIKILGKSKASERGHMTFVDMLDEYARIALN